jgi:hypothetical protein
MSNITSPPPLPPPLSLQKQVVLINVLVLSGSALKKLSLAGSGSEFGIRSESTNPDPPPTRWQKFVNQKAGASSLERVTGRNFTISKWFYRSKRKLWFGFSITKDKDIKSTKYY